MVKPTLYLMLGYPGAGKTTVSEYIAEFTDAVHINSDQFRLHMFEEPLHITSAQHEKMYELLDDITERILKSGKSVIYDANLNLYAHRKDKYDICKRANAEPKLIWVKTGEQIARRRATVDAPKHPDHRPFGNMKQSTFDRLIQQIEPPTEDEKPIILSGEKISPEAIRRAI